MVRRNVTRYACTAIVETLRMVSSPVKKRFPTYRHMVEAGLMTEDEVMAIMGAQSKSEFMQYVYWVPISWASALIVQAYQKANKYQYDNDI